MDYKKEKNKRKWEYKQERSKLEQLMKDCLMYLKNTCYLLGIVVLLLLAIFLRLVFS